MADSINFDELKQGVTQFPEVAMAPGDVVTEVEKIIRFLEASQYEVIELMVANKIWRGPQPKAPKPRGDGELEFGLVPRWLEYPPEIIERYLEKHRWLQWLWQKLSGVVPNRIDDTNYDALRAAVRDGGVIANDGTLYGEGKYEQLDPNWVWSAVDYLIVHFGKDRADFPAKQVAPIQLTGRLPDRVTIAMLGDWGTGAFTNGAAIEIMDQITRMKPDYVVHLGDVYYAGTPGADQPFMPPNEEEDNFLSCWPGPEKQRPGTSFALNSNHEMYSGAKGLFSVALQKNGPFTAQQGTSYFALQYAGWTLLGLDSAFFSTSPLFMVGSIGGNDDPQPSWIKSLNLSPDRVIVLSHHNGLTFDGTSEPKYPADSPTTFWDQVNAALGGDPALWYWGHIHNGIVYKTPTVTNRKTLARCLGHAALPFGNAWGIEQKPEYVEWYTHTPNPAAGPKRVKNGFVLVTIESNGQVTEEFFEQGASATSPVFANTL